MAHETAAEAANATFVKGFLDCLKFHNASDYGYNVNPAGFMTLTPLDNNTNYRSYDLTPYKACNHLFGLAIDVRFDFGFRTYHPDESITPLEGVTADALINEGLCARDLRSSRDFSAAPPVNNATMAVMMAMSMGFNETEIEAGLGIPIANQTDLLAKRDTYYTVYATDEDKICNHCDYGMFYESTCYNH